MEKNKYPNICEIFTDWVETNIVTRKTNFSEIKFDFIRFLEMNKKVEYYKFINDIDIDLILIDWIATLVEKNILIKEDNGNRIRYIYNQNILNKKQKKMVKKHKIKKICIFIFITILIIFIIGMIVFSQVKQQIEKRKEEEKIALEEKRVAEEIVKDIAEEYYLEDLEYDHIEIGTLYGTVYYKSELFESLNDTNKILFITSIEEKTRSKKLFPNGSKASGLYYDLVIMSNGHKYKDFTTSGESWLMKDNIKVFSMETNYAKEVEESFRKTLSRPSSSSSNSSSSSSSTKKYYSIQRNYSGCYPNKPHYVCYEKGRCRCVRYY